MSSQRDHEENTRVIRWMEETGQTKWGFVVYRCTYGDDAAWARFMEILNEHVREALSYCPEEDVVRKMLETLNWHVFSDQALFDGASKDTVREHFRAWLESDEAKAEQARGCPRSRNVGHWATRFQYPLHIDADSLDSVVNRMPKLPEYDYGYIGFVNLIDLDWKTVDPATFPFEALGMDPENDDPADEGCEPIDGCRMHEVGWMKVAVAGLMPDMYAALQSSGRYYVEYRRPPRVCNPLGT